MRRERPAPSSTRHTAGSGGLFNFSAEHTGAVHDTNQTRCALQNCKDFIINMKAALCAEPGAAGCGGALAGCKMGSARAKNVHSDVEWSTWQRRL